MESGNQTGVDGGIVARGFEENGGGKALAVETEGNSGVPRGVGPGGNGFEKGLGGRDVGEGPRFGGKSEKGCGSGGGSGWGRRLGRRIEGWKDGWNGNGINDGQGFRGGEGRNGGGIAFRGGIGRGGERWNGGGGDPLEGMGEPDRRGKAVDGGGTPVADVGQGAIGGEK